MNILPVSLWMIIATYIIFTNRKKTSTTDTRILLPSTNTFQRRFNLIKTQWDFAGRKYRLSRIMNSYDVSSIGINFYFSRTIVVVTWELFYWSDSMRTC